MADYTYAELMKMQNDAVKRVEDMQKKARKYTETPKAQNSSQQVKSGALNEPKHIPMPDDYLEKLKNYAHNSSHTYTQSLSSAPPQEEQPEPISEKVPSETSANTFADLNIDPDKALILALIMLLSEEKGDELLVLALIYMLT